ncbi:ABC-F family ATP-binding cassette domain-containing protein [Aquirufa ecclesiirivi]|uniref:ABC-F family ATP-binding cassette domain-containing protein n=1 Tax=Aquirufa ecclesiirivi TaxID=2715124 RepID=A0ABT4JIQ7_9BACT|nr:ABC-F family ATP-binding cassette domain-containing protein [Aquirufa ecclesiirivi]MCZ2476164.1 ABC-F family ATP-binding cassette domain-containing protein [Aquirufa ecclesiirivi]MDF0693531.1 ABC-F family ATP-binding cassette domain-containing protein [Aquirufa ecclesiirivi]NHC49438.1 ABC-F family ATP-binding cassette domain-containing protein [Aquirufa ecclesiirivi]
MNYLSAENISRNLGERWVFKNLFFGLQKGEKVSLIGKNGTGKTTLMETLMGLQSPDEGKVTIRKGIRVGYLPQNPIFQENEEVLNYLFSDDLPSAQAIKAYEKAMISGDAKELEDSFALMEAHNAWDYEARAKQIITRLGIPDGDQKVSTLSGGQKKRLSLAKLLIESPDIMILDEPTNHLDIETIEWLEGILSGPNVTVLVVSHDRYFLDKVCNKMLELSNGSIYTYEGNYAYFLEKKAEREASEASTISKAKNLYRKELEWMRRQPKARGTKAQSRIDAFAETEEVAHRKTDDSKLELNIQMSRLGNKIIEINHLKKAWGEKKIVNDFTYTFKKKDRIGIVGKNGAGKTTFLQLLTGLEQPDAGTIDPGETLVIGYYTQIPFEFKPEQRVIDTITEIAEVIPYGKNESLTPSQFLSKFLFPTAQQYTPVEKLSGGEKKRLQLMQVLVKNPNFLILDEPTNDLDLDTLQLLEDFLSEFQGCLLLVSHDRYFMDNLVDQLILVEGEGEVNFFNGNYTDYRIALENKEKEPAVEKKNPAPVIENKPTPKGAKLSFKEAKELEELEKEMAVMEGQKEALIERLSKGSDDFQDLTAWAAEIERLKNSLEEKELRWLELSERA